MASAPNQIRVSTQPHGDVRVIRVEGNVSTDAEAPLGNAYEAICASGVQHIVLSFREGDYIDSAGIALIIHLAAEARERGQILRIAQPSRHFRRVFTDIIGLNEYVDIFGSEEEALRDFGPRMALGAS